MAHDSKAVHHATTTQRIATFLSRPAQTLLITGPAGIGKSTLAQELASKLLMVELEQLIKYPYLTIIDDSESSISIDSVRQLQQSLTRKLPGTSQRVIIIEAADRLGEEAQNALLKSLEEPPERTTWLLTAHNPRALLPTVRSRMSELAVVRPAAKDLQNYFVEQGFAAIDIERAQLMSGGLPGLMQAMLASDASHPLLQASDTARKIVQADRFERLAMVDSLSKDKPQTIAALEILQAMAHVSITQGKQVDRWQTIMSTTYRAIEELQQNTQPKLVLTNLMLHL